MRRALRAFLPPLLASLIGMALWAALVLFGTLEGWGRAKLAPPGDGAAFMAAAQREIAAQHKGNVAFRLLRDGRVIGEYFVSAGEPVDADTLFQVASLSKWITAFGVMHLVDAGKLDLDAPVSTYLRRWSLPPSEFANNEVTVRRLLSHTAGLTDDLGYAGFVPGAPVQQLEASLTRASDASPGKDGRVRVGLKPGSEWRYSGGGYTLLQLLIEEASGEPFADYMRRAVFLPLGMTRSTFVVDANTANVAAMYNVDGKPATHFKFTALAATSLYTSAADMTRFVQAQLVGPNGEPPGRGLIKPSTLNLMRQPHASTMGADIWGLGTMLYVPLHDGGFIVGHDGNNEPAINTAVRLNPANGDAIVVLETGNKLLATEIAGKWAFWQAGAIDFLTALMSARTMLQFIAAGGFVIFVGGLFVGSRRWRRTDG